MNAALIAKLEAADEGSRELNVDIQWLVGRPSAERAYWNAATGLPRPLVEMPTQGLGYANMLRCARRFTTCTDTALTLLPDTSCNIVLSNFRGHGEGSGFAWAFQFADTAQLMGKRAATEQIERMYREHPLGAKIVGPVRVELEDAIAEHFIEFHCEYAATPALAVCVAALKARG